jgi:hypothetical protein
LRGLSFIFEPRKAVVPESSKLGTEARQFPSIRQINPPRAGAPHRQKTARKQDADML